MKFTFLLMGAFFSFCLASLPGAAQRWLDPTMDDYLMTKTGIHSSFAALHNEGFIAANGDFMLVPFPGTPYDITISGLAPVGKKGGFFTSLTRNVIGPEVQHRLGTAYAHEFRIGQFQIVPGLFASTGTFHLSRGVINLINNYQTYWLGEVTPSLLFKFRSTYIGAQRPFYWSSSKDIKQGSDNWDDTEVLFGSKINIGSRVAVEPVLQFGQIYSPHLKVSILGHFWNRCFAGLSKQTGGEWGFMGGARVADLYFAYSQRREFGEWQWNRPLHSVTIFWKLDKE